MGITGWLVILLSLTVSLLIQTGVRVETPCMSDAPDEQTLRQTYNSYNERYFNGRLPNTILIYYGAAKGNTALTRRVGNDFQIELNPQHNMTERQASVTLLHEMCHVRTWGETPTHGKHFIFELRRLMLEGAFDDVL